MNIQAIIERNRDKSLPTSKANYSDMSKDQVYDLLTRQKLQNSPIDRKLVQKLILVENNTQDLQSFLDYLESTPKPEVINGLHQGTTLPPIPHDSKPESVSPAEEVKRNYLTTLTVVKDQTDLPPNNTEPSTFLEFVQHYQKQKNWFQYKAEEEGEDFGLEHKQEEAISEPLAKVLASQGHKDQAIAMYEKLSLKNPEKRAYFADEIEKLKN